MILKNKLFKKKFIFFIFLLIIGILVGIKHSYSYYTTTGKITSTSGYVSIPSFNPSVDLGTNIELSNVAPGTQGRFKIDVNFSDVETESFYEITYDDTNIPKNLHFYADAQFTTRISSIKGVQKKEKPKLAEHFIYWKWDYVDSPEANADDSRFMSQTIVIPFNVRVSQSIEHTIIVNNVEKPTGRITLTGEQGSFNMRLDFQNFAHRVENLNYIIYFNTSEFLGNLELYSDSSFNDRISSITGTFDGTNIVINQPVYYKFEGSQVGGNLYYMVYVY